MSTKRVVLRYTAATAVTALMTASAVRSYRTGAEDTIRSADLKAVLHSAGFDVATVNRVGAISAAALLTALTWTAALA